MIDRVSYSNGAPPPPGAGLTVLDTPADQGRAVPLPDGGMEIHYGDETETRLSDLPFDANLAEALSNQTLQRLASELRQAVDDDLNSRKEWEAALIDGMDLLGIKSVDRTIPWAGACGVVHPMILEAAVRFQSKSITRLFPSDGPAQAKIIGEASQAKLAQAERVASDLNHWIVEKMPEYRDETEQLLFALPVDGSAFRKVYFDPLLKRPVAQFVAANDFIQPYGFPNLETCPRYTHVLKQSFADVLRLQGRGFYRDCPMSETPISLDRIEEKVTRLGGMSPSYSTNDLLTLREIHVDLQLDELRDSDEPVPYIVTIETVSNQVLALRRNWREKDPERRKILYFCHYRYVPWKGAYGLGLIHLIGGIGKGSTSILRQLVDAGTLANLPGGLKTRGMRVKGDSDPIMPGEWRDVDIPTGKIADCVYPLPYKEPSAVLFQLLQMLVSEGKSFASIAELDITTSSQNAPVGTMLALIERATEVISAVQARLHTTLGRELTILAEIIRDYTSQVYEYEPVNAPRSAKADDYAQQLSIIPVSDPASATMAQRVMEYQAAMQLSAQAPQLYNLPLLHRSMLEVLGIDNADQIVPDKSEVDPADPVSENMALLTSKPVKAYEWQDHEAHLTVHQLFLQDPKIQQGLGQTPLMPSIMSAAQAHIAEHMAHQYRKDIELQMGVPLPASSTKLPAEVEEQLSGVEAQAAQKLLQQNQAQAQAKQAQQTQQDPMLQLQQQELQIKQQGIQQKAQTDQAKLQLDQAKLAQKSQSDQAKLESAERRTQAEISGELQRTTITAGVSHAGIASTERQAVLDHQFDHSTLASKERQGALKHLVDMQESANDRAHKTQESATDRAQEATLQPAPEPFPQAPDTGE
jgi:hypothetical protein